MPTTPSQTVGPFFAIELPYGDGPYVVPEGTAGAVWLRGRVLDGDGAPVPDALVESWQADPAGQAPPVALAIFARALLHQVVTRLYFADEGEANAADPVLAGLDEQARATLVAQPSADGYELDIHLQDPDETTFFAV